MPNEIIYNNGDVKLAHQTKIQFRSNINNKILTGMIIGQESTQFIVWINSSITAKIHTKDILQIAIPCGDDEYFISLKEYQGIRKTKLTYQESCTIVNCLSSAIKEIKNDKKISKKLKQELLKHNTQVLEKYSALENQILELSTN